MRCREEVSGLGGEKGEGVSYEFVSTDKRCQAFRRRKGKGDRRSGLGRFDRCCGSQPPS